MLSIRVSLCVVVAAAFSAVFSPAAIASFDPVISWSIGAFNPPPDTSSGSTVGQYGLSQTIFNTSGLQGAAVDSSLGTDPFVTANAMTNYEGFGASATVSMICGVDITYNGSGTPVTIPLLITSTGNVSVSAESGPQYTANRAFAEIQWGALSSNQQSLVSPTTLGEAALDENGSSGQMLTGGFNFVDTEQVQVGYYAFEITATAAADVEQETNGVRAQLMASAAVDPTVVIDPSFPDASDYSLAYTTGVLPPAVPEPSTFALLGLGFFAALRARRRVRH